MRVRQLHPVRVLLCVVLLAVGGSAITTSGASAGKPKPKRVGAVYTETNELDANAVVKFVRYSDGSLKKKQTLRTGGKGSTQSIGCGPGCPILDSSGAVDVTKNGKLVFVVNAGSDTVSSFRETDKGLQLVDQEASGGDLPESLTAANGLLYVLNVDSANISGLRYSKTGRLKPIEGSTEPLIGPASPPEQPGSARQIGFDNSGRVLVVTELLTPPGPMSPPGVIDTFVLGDDDTPGPAKPHGSETPAPFGFDFDPDNRLVVSEVRNPEMGTGTTSSYSLDGAGAVTPIDTEETQAALPCWVAITPDGKYAYVVNTGAGKPATITRYKIESNGALTFLGNTSVTGTFAITDAALSRDGKFLYVLAPSVMGSKTSHVRRYRVRGNGGLKFLGSTPSNLPTGVTGLDAR